MKTITVKLHGHDQHFLEVIQKRLSNIWSENTSISDVIRYSLYTTYCYEIDKPDCAKCYYENMISS